MNIVPIFTTNMKNMTTMYKHYRCWMVCVLPTWSNHHSELMHPQIKQVTFFLFIGIASTCWLENKGNNNRVSLMKFYAKFVYSINLEHSKFMNESTKTFHNWVHTTIKKCKHLAWHISHDLCFKKRLLNIQKKKNKHIIWAQLLEKTKSSKDHNTIEILWQK
jgi:hypothetical protein